MKIEHQKMLDFFESATQANPNKILIREEWAVAFQDGIIDANKVKGAKLKCKEFVSSQSNWIRDEKWNGTEIDVRDCEYEETRYPNSNTVVAHGYFISIMYK